MKSSFIGGFLFRSHLGGAAKLPIVVESDDEIVDVSGIEWLGEKCVSASLVGLID